MICLFVAFNHFQELTIFLIDSSSVCLLITLYDFQFESVPLNVVGIISPSQTKEQISFTLFHSKDRLLHHLLIISYIFLSCNLEGSRDVAH